MKKFVLKAFHTTKLELAVIVFIPFNIAAILLPQDSLWPEITSGVIYYEVVSVLMLLAN